MKLVTRFLLLYLCITTSVVADVPLAQLSEVNHLFAFIKDSGCTINRNGIDHPAAKGLQHIRKKYDYFRDDIKSTEDFIDYSASKSTMSGEYYTVKCSGKETIKTRDWLLLELKRLRAASIVCQQPRPQICTREYNPVCATYKNSSKKTGSTGCTACSDPNVVSYKMGAC